MSTLTSHHEPSLPTLVLVPADRRAATVAVSLLLLMLLLLAGLAWLPWQQYVAGTGRVIAFAPNERRQPVQAPIDGRVALWHVVEGERVRQGQVLVDLADNDPELMMRLEAELEAANAMLADMIANAASLDARVQSLTDRGEAAVQSAEASFRASEQSVRAAEQEVEAAEAALTTAQLQYDRVLGLHGQGLVSTRELELAELDRVRAETTLQGRRASLQNAREDRLSREANVQTTRSSQQSDVESALASWQSALAGVQSQQRSILQLQSRMARQQTQQVVAPIDGVVFRVEALQGGGQVKAGDVLLTLIPDTRDRAVELRVDGNDIPLLQVGSHVRLQFEGWPAVQFVGWPAVAVGTFGGRVAVIDTADDGYGDFRVLVVPDEASDPWPDPRYLRQGVRANSWFMLETVPLYFELWRRFNGFPPVLESEPSGSYTAPSTPVPHGGEG